jgi:hypothetical protein
MLDLQIRYNLQMAIDGLEKIAYSIDRLTFKSGLSAAH